MKFHQNDNSHESIFEVKRDDLRVLVNKVDWNFTIIIETVHLKRGSYDKTEQRLFDNI